MGKEYSIPIAADVGRFIKGTDDIEEALDQVADSLDHVADLSDDSATTAADSMDSLGDAAKDAGHHIEDSADDGAKALKDLGDTAKDSTKEISKGVKDAGKDLDKLGDGAKDQAKEVARQGEKIEDSLGEIAKSADTSAEKTEKSFSDAWAKIRTESKKATKAIGDDTADVGENAFDGLKEEGADSAREAAASFTGEFDDVGDFVQEVMANAFQTAGPLGMGAGLALAAGFGIAVSKITESAERYASAVERRFEDMAENMEDTLSVDFVDEEIKSILNDSEDALIDFSGAQAVAARTGLDLSTVLRGYGGDATAAEQVMERLGSVTYDNADGMNGYRQALSDAAGATSDAKAKFDAYEATQRGAGTTLRRTADSLDGLSDAMREQKDAADAARQASADLYEQTANLNDIFSETAAEIAETTAAGGDQTQMLLDQKATVAGAASEYQGYLDTLAASGATSSQVQAEYDRLTGEIRKLGDQAGLSDADIDAMIATIMAVPPTTTHKISVQGDQRAKAQIREVAATAAGVRRNIDFSARVITPAWQIANQAAALAAAARPVISVLAKVTRVIG